MKNKLLYYEGGGYDGCYWEWNFCFWDTDGKWHDLYSSGCAGANTEVKALEIAKDIGTIGTCKFDPALIDLTNKEQYLQFQKENNARLVLEIAQELNENHNYDIEVLCNECGCNFTADRSENDQATDNDTVVCGECYSAGMCADCGEYVGVDVLNENATDVCPDCIEYQDEQGEQDEQEDMLFNSFATGTPDLFSNEMQWYWGI